MICKDVNCRTILWFLVFFGCGVNYMIRSNINIAIVAMVKQYAVEESNISSSECFKEEPLTNYSKNTSEVTSNDGLDEIRFNWNEHQQSHVLGAYFWTYWLSQISGGALAKKYGTKAVFGLSNLFLCLTTYFIPLFSKWNLWALVSLRLFQGIVGGFCWPSLHNLVAHWIPPNERSKFMSAYTGSSVGAAITYPLCGIVIHFLGWEAVFYITATLGVIWFSLWWLLAHDTPAAHPRITHQEMSYIHHCIGETLSQKQLETPWLKIITSKQVWLTTYVSWGCLWGMFTLLTQAPTYFQFVHGWSIRMNGFLSGIPHVCRTLLGIGLAYVSDIFLERGVWSCTTVRKIAAGVCCIVQCACLMGLAFSGCNSLVAIIFLTVALASTGAESPGPLAAYVDLSPNHASILFGISNMVTVAPGFISPVIVGYLTYQNQTAGQWQIVFFIAAAMAIVPGILYILFGSADVQPWNSTGVKSEEMHHLKNKATKKNKNDF